MSDAQNHWLAVAKPLARMGQEVGGIIKHHSADEMIANKASRR